MNDLCELYKLIELHKLIEFTIHTTTTPHRKEV